MEKRLLFLATSILCALAVLARANATTQPYTLQEMLKGYAGAVAFKEHVSYVAKMHLLCVVNGKIFPPTWSETHEDKGWGSYRKILRRDGARMEVLAPKPGVALSQANLNDPENMSSHTIVCDQNVSVSAGEVEHPRPGVARGSVVEQSWAGFTQARLATFLGDFNLLGGGYLDGGVWGTLNQKLPVDDDLPRILQNASDARVVATEDINGHTTYVVECTFDGHSFKVWLDPRVGFQPRKIEQRRLDPNGPGSDVTVDKVVFATVSGRVVAVSARIVLDELTSDQYVRHFENEYERSDIDFQPDFQGIHAFIMAAPSDFAVANIDFPNKRWMLKEGKIVPWAREDVVADVEGGAEAAVQEAGTRPAGELAAAPLESHLVSLLFVGIALVGACVIAAYVFNRRARVGKGT